MSAEDLEKVRAYISPDAIGATLRQVVSEEAEIDGAVNAILEERVPFVTELLVMACEDHLNRSGLTENLDRHGRCSLVLGV